MTIKEATLKVMNKWCNTHTPVRQVDIFREVSRITGKSLLSCRSNAFRNKNNIPELWVNYIEVKHNGYTSYLKGKSAYNQNYNKPKEYFEMLKELNKCETIYTLAGTHSHCMKILDKNKTLTVDISPHTSPDIRGDIYNLRDREAYNFDTEGRITKKKIDFINDLYLRGAKKVLLTFRRSKNDYLLNEIKGFYLGRVVEYKSGNAKMEIRLYHL